MSTGGDIGSIENKRLLWSFLTEESVFNGIGQDGTPQIINIFETAINTVKNTRTDNVNLATLNKEVIRRIIPEIARYRASVTSGSAAAAATAGIQDGAEGADTKYRAADMQEARIRDITSKLKIHEDDMNSFLVLKKPAEINFADSKTDGDRPIGKELDQLIEAALASRARELEILQVHPPPPISTQSDEPAYTYTDTDKDKDKDKDKRMVSFSNDSAVDPTISIIASPPTSIHATDTTDTTDTTDIDAIVNKFKRSGEVGGNKPSIPNSNAMLREIIESLRMLTQTVAEIQRDVRDLRP